MYYTSSKVFVLAVNIRETPENPDTTQSHAEELYRLIATLGWNIAAKTQCTLQQTGSHHMIGSGRLEVISELAGQTEAELSEQDPPAYLDSIVFDCELPPSQLFHLEKHLKMPVIDRKALILKIFEQYASTKEARLQVQLARLYYERPRLKRAWQHLSRQQGGRYGTRGEGETQIEIDARLINQQIHKLEQSLQQVLKQREQQRKRSRTMKRISLIGYTNAGKSALMQTLSRKEIYVADRLFATLDPKSSRLQLGGETVILTDTVGFVRNLPHELIDAFRATLEETALADLQAVVLDIADPEWPEKRTVVERVLRDLQVSERPRLLIFNKIDLLEPAELEALQKKYPEAAFVSAQTGAGADELLRRFELLLIEPKQSYLLELDWRESQARAWLYRHKLVRSEEAGSQKNDLYLAIDTEQYQDFVQRYPECAKHCRPLSPDEDHF